jgi:hypothetical protein
MFLIACQSKIYHLSRSIGLGGRVLVSCEVKFLNAVSPPSVPGRSPAEPQIPGLVDNRVRRLSTSLSLVRHGVSRSKDRRNILEAILRAGFVKSHTTGQGIVVANPRISQRKSLCLSPKHEDQGRLLLIELEG